MAVVEGVVQVAPDSTGKSIANVVITRTDGVVVYRQELVLADAESEAFRAVVTNLGALAVDPDITRASRRIAEQAFVAESDQTDLLAAKRSERISYMDRRGSVGRGSTR